MGGETGISGIAPVGWRVARRRRQLMIRLALGPGMEGNPRKLLEDASQALPPELLHQNRLSPLLFDQWVHLRPSLAPEGGAWLDQLRDLLHADAAAMLPRERDWEELLRASVRAGLTFCLLKGSALRAAGRSLPGRTQGDLDLLVRVEELERAEAFFRSRGYRLLTGYRSREGYLQEHFHFPMMGPEGHVELHWSLGRCVPDAAIRRFWERSMEVEVGGVSARILAPPDRLIHSCIHISEHAFGGMARWLGELAQELRALESGESTHFLHEAEHWNPRIVGAPLHLLARWGEELGPVVASTLERFSATGSSLLAESLTAAAFEDQLPGIPPHVLTRAVANWLRTNRPFSITLGTVYLRAVGEKVRRGRGSGGPPTRNDPGAEGQGQAP